MQIYKVGFHDDPLVDYEVVKAFDLQTAAEKFASYAFDNRDMWEFGDAPWTEANMVSVIDEQGNKTNWLIQPEAQITFSAEEVEQEADNA